VFFEEDSNGTFSGDSDIYEVRTTDGVNFSTPSNLSNSTDQEEVLPLVATDHNGVAFVVWADTANSNRPPKLDAFVLRDVGCQ